jgi:hypothetical protein
MARCLFQDMYESRGTDSKRTVKDEAGVLRTDSVEVLFQRCFTSTFLYARSIRMLHLWRADSKGGFLNVEIILRQDRLCASFVIRAICTIWMKCFSGHRGNENV